MKIALRSSLELSQVTTNWRGTSGAKWLKKVKSAGGARGKKQHPRDRQTLKRLKMSSASQVLSRCLFFNHKPNMKLIIAQTELDKLLEIVSHAVPKRPAHPILSNLLLVCNTVAQQLTITAFDHRLGIRATCACDVQQDGQIALPAKLLSDVVSQLPKNSMTLELRNNAVVLTHATGKCQIQAVSAEEFPALPEINNTITALPTHKLLQLLKATLFAASRDESKQVINGVHFKFFQSNCEAAATDGHRLAVAAVAVETDLGSTSTTQEPIEATIPCQSLVELKRLLVKVPNNCNCTIGINEAIAVFDLPNLRVTSRLLEGQYPPYHSLIPQQFQYHLKIDKQTLEAALKRLAIVAENKNNTAKATFDLKQQLATLQARSPSLGSAVESVALGSQSDSQEQLDIGFNLKYLIDGLEHISTSEVTIKANQPNTPVILNPVNDSLAHLVLVMPLEITGAWEEVENLQKESPAQPEEVAAAQTEVKAELEAQSDDAALDESIPPQAVAGTTEAPHDESEDEVNQEIAEIAEKKRTKAKNPKKKSQPAAANAS